MRQHDRSQHTLFGMGGGSASLFGEGGGGGNGGHLTLYELNSLVRDAIELTLPGDYWVEAELSEVRERGGHCYMELVQKDIDGNSLVARASAKCWRSVWQTARPQFEKVTGQSLHAGMQVLLRVHAQFHESYGFSWIVTGIDPTFTLGDMARKRQEVIKRLKAEGVFELNKELPLSPFAQRIAVISSDTAAGYGDFCNQLDTNSFGFAFSVTLFQAVMQDCLNPGSYTIRAFATNEAGTGYSEPFTLTIKALNDRLPVMGEVSYTDDGYFYGQVFDDGGLPIIYQGFCWSKESAEPVWDSAWSVFSSTNFFSKIELSPGHYYLRAFAVNEGGVGYSEPIEITIDSEDEGYLPLLGEITPVEGMSDLYQCEVLDDRGMEISVRGFCWVTDSSMLPTIWSDRLEVDESFIFDATNLSSAGNYYVRAYVVTASGEIVYSTSTVIKR